MQIKIQYYYSKADSESNPFWAKSEVNNEWVCSCGTSWDEARTRQIQKLTDRLNAPEPPHEETVDL
jgi:hypothetical protein